MTLFCDLDGVMADFNAGCLRVTGKLPHEQPVKDMWRALSKEKNFFGTLPKMADADILWDAIKHKEPTFLTGCPLGNWAPGQKRYWVQETFATDRIITTFSSQKHEFCKPGDILIDDRIKLKEKWEAAGGFFVYHTSAADTIAQLVEIGIIDG